MPAVLYCNKVYCTGHCTVYCSDQLCGQSTNSTQEQRQLGYTGSDRANSPCLEWEFHSNPLINGLIQHTFKINFQVIP